MFKKTHIASAIVLAFSCQLSYAQDEVTNTPPDSTDDIEVIQVSGIRGSLNKALDEKRASVQIVDAIVAEDIGKFPDNNVVEALQRVSGVQTTGRGGGEVSSVSIRGLSDVHTTVNGRDVFTGSGRDVSLQDIPASLLSGVTVYKTRSAKQVERGIAGSIDIKTQRPFNFDGKKVVLAARGIYSDQPDKVDPNLSMLLSNRWDLDGAGEFGALVNVSYSKTHYRDDTLAAGAALPYFTNQPATGFRPYSPIPRTLGAPGNETSVWQSLENGLPTTPGSALDINGQSAEYLLGRDAVFGNSFSGERKRPAITASFQWAPNDTLELTAEGFYTGYRNESQNSLWHAFSYNDNVGIETPVTYDDTNVIKQRQTLGADGFVSGDATSQKTDTYLYALGAKWQASDYLTINSELVYQKSDYESDFLAMRFNRATFPTLNVDYNNGGGVPAVVYEDDPNTPVNEADMSAVANWNAADLYDNGDGNSGDSIAFTFDAEYLFGGTYIDKVSFGGRYEKRTAEAFTRTQNKYQPTSLTNFMSQLVEAGVSDDGSGLIYQVDDYFDGRANVFNNFIAADGGYLLDNVDAVRSVYGFNKEDKYKTFDIEEDSYALYSTMNFYLFENISGEVGARYVKYNQDMKFQSLLSKNPAQYDQTVESESINKLLPSLSLNWNITEDIVGRVAYTETLRMPNYADLSSVARYEDPITKAQEYGTGSTGNPNLQATESKNYDLSLEWYFADTSSLYASYFKREIDGLVISSRRNVVREGDDGETRPYVVSFPGNASDGELSGLELGLVYFPENLPAVLDGLGMQASYTNLDSSQDTPDFDSLGNITGYTETSMTGVSDESVSVVGIYERESFDMRLSYLWRSAFYSGTTDATFANPLQIWNRPEQSLDFQVSYDVSEELTVTFDATNLLDDKYQTYYGEGNENLFNAGSSIFSRTFALGARYSF
ncbi:TonB-dependent receptor [Pseudoalteromonas sp. SG43-7]|uniref:TonB-dependent receptor n=1 Tax=unclassified Pseudoalteromonas TaxID=194690 RepID=UPI0015FFA85E|nr:MULTISPECIES: TonB-dependent receptor [unclassified Pseudoalteromonas]MBB1422234.1 TonB-dependent receptor [Pseudoalteromonas sp. SG43-7]MBB1469641.1 TonB-dependent receptor [Pseudoalteromonas sp. SG41-5]